MKFAFAKTHKLCDPCWLAVIDNQDSLFFFHKKVAVRLALKFGQDPHLWSKDGKPLSDVAYLYSPVKLASQWMGTAQKMFWEYGCVYMNRVGGLCHLPEVLNTVESENWPDPKPIAGETVYISKWPNGDHYYLRSSKDRIFPVEKVDSLTEAEKIAKEFAPNCEVVFNKEPARLVKGLMRPDGD